uniref:CCHC-type domain-containing protein n=1 Tax=Cannabis sativa TaxID=3483 RepID=A0A803NSM2_CANSA
MILCLPSILQNTPFNSVTITPFWVQVFRLPFLSKSESLARVIGNLIGTFLEMITFSWMVDELWLEYRYERLLDFCYECGVVGHVFDKCPIFLEKLDEGREPDLPYGPWMEGSALLKSSYDCYRHDFSKADPYCPTAATYSLNVDIDKHYSKGSISSPLTYLEAYFVMSAHVTTTANSSSCHQEKENQIKPGSPSKSIFLSMATPPAFIHLSPSHDNSSPSQQDRVISIMSTTVTTLPHNCLAAHTLATGLEPNFESANENRLSSLFSNRQITPLTETTNIMLHQDPIPSFEMAHISLSDVGNGASLAKVDVQPHKSP